jgi:hypothetical protein
MPIIKETKNKKRKRIIFMLAAFLSLAVFLQWFQASAKYTYPPMEDLPGFNIGTGTDQFKNLVEGIYKFGIWTVGIAALLMITIGGFMYMTSAGNTSKAGTAKGIITDAIYGLIVALFAWLLLNVINPDLTNINISMTALPSTVVSSSPVSPGSTVPKSSTVSGVISTCVEPTSGSCSVNQLTSYSTCWGSNVNKASAICNGESANGKLLTSTVDRCLPSGSPVSFGLFQINITANKLVTSSGTLDCPSAFSAVYTSKNHTCTIKDQTLYDKCRTAALDPKTNIDNACAIYSSGGWNRWGFNSKCKF